MLLRFLIVVLNIFLRLASSWPSPMLSKLVLGGLVVALVLVISIMSTIVYIAKLKYL